jgi:hypothetical protein
MLPLPSPHVLGRNVDEAALKYQYDRNVDEAALNSKWCFSKSSFFGGKINRGRNVDQAAFIDISKCVQKLT